MSSAVENHAEDFHIRDWMLELSVGVMAVVLGTSVWVYMQLSHSKPVQERPRPVWLGVDKVMAQMSDGRMVNIKVNLRLKDQKAIDELSPHKPAFKALIQEAGTQVTHDELQDTQGMKHFSSVIRASINDYLEDESVHVKIKDVVFDELMLMP
jgi:flagellar basal body-associated protein FliL